MTSKNKNILLAFFLLCFLILTFFVVQKNSFILTLDTSLAAYTATLHSPFLDTFMLTITSIGDVYQILFLFIILAIVFLVERKKYMLYELVFTLGLGGILPEAIKLFVQRVRPVSQLLVETDYSFPSAHATIATVLWCIATFLVAPLIKKHTLRKVFITLSSILFPLIAFSRIYLSVHWGSDIVGGILLGSVCYLFSNIVVLHYERKA